jgi:citrate synthase
MIYAELKSMHSPDVFDLENYLPENPECFGFLLQTLFGAKDEIGEESFDIMVCTPAWITSRLKENEVFMGRHHLLMKNYNFPALKSYIIEYSRQCPGENWSEVAEKLSRLGHWEFEDYVPKE